MNEKLVLLVTCTVVSILGRAGSASADVIDQFKVKGKSAVVVCSHTETVNCNDPSFPEFTGTIQTDIHVSGDELITRSSSFPVDTQNHLFVTAVVSNSCTFESFATVGSLENGYSFQSLQSASLQGVVPLRNFDDNSPAGSISVDVSLQGFGATTMDKDKLRFPFPLEDGSVLVFSSTFKGKTRSATASGTLVLNGEPVTCTFHDGMLLDINQGAKVVEHQ
jgi:hypothetical protein